MVNLTFLIIGLVMIYLSVTNRIYNLFEILLSDEEEDKSDKKKKKE